MVAGLVSAAVVTSAALAQTPTPKPRRDCGRGKLIVHGPAGQTRTIGTLGQAPNTGTWNLRSPELYALIVATPRPAMTPTPVPTATPRPTVADPNAPCRALTPGWCWHRDGVRIPSCAVGPCSCAPCSTLATPAPTATPTPARTPAPTRTPTPTGTAIVVVDLPIAEVWWPPQAWTSLADAFGTMPGTLHATRERYYCSPDIPNVSVVPAEKCRAGIQWRAAEVAAGRLPAEAAPRAFVAEGDVWDWCVRAARSGGFAGKTPATVPPIYPDDDPIAGNVRLRITDATTWGAKGVTIAPFLFTRNHTLSLVDRQAMARAFGAGFLSQPFEVRPFGRSPQAPDVPTDFVVRAMAACWDRWLWALRGQHPQVEVVAQLSNGCNAFNLVHGGRKLGLGAPALIAAAMRKHGFDPAIQLEVADCQMAGVAQFRDSPPIFDCELFRAARDTGARLSVFDGDRYLAALEDVRRCLR